MHILSLYVVGVGPSRVVQKEYFAGKTYSYMLTHLHPVLATTTNIIPRDSAINGPCCESFHLCAYNQAPLARPSVHETCCIHYTKTHT